MNTHNKPVQPTFDALHMFTNLVRDEKWREIEIWYNMNAPWLTEQTISNIIKDLKEESEKIKVKIIEKYEEEKIIQ